MKYLIVILMLFMSSSVFATVPDSASLATCVTELNAALIGKDSVKLKRLLRDDVRYTHSNGWVETKRDVIMDLYNGKLTYRQIDVQSQDIRVAGNMGQARMNVAIDVTMRGRPLQMKLGVFQNWVWNGSEWKLVVRRSQKI